MRAGLGLGLLLALPAQAADVDLFNPSGSLVHAQGTLQGESGTLSDDGLSLGILAWLAKDLAVAEHPDGSVDPLVASLFALPLYGAYTIGDKARIEALVPLYLYTDAPFSGFQGAALGDVELRALVPLWSHEQWFALAVRPSLGFPTGTATAGLKEGFSGGLTVAVSGDILDNVGWVGNVGLRGKATDSLETATLGSTFDALGGVWWEAQPGFRVGAEANGSIGLSKLDDTRRNGLFTAHGFAQITAQNGFGLALGAGSGVGVGAPAYRVFAALTWAPLIKDADRDRVADDDDACPADPEDRDGWEDGDGCPDADNDGDSMLDADDLCPDEAEDVDGFSDLDGCPDPDNDEDGLLDVDDACPDLAGAAEYRGCPDADADGVFDDVDECRTEAGPAATKGCPDGDADLVPDFRDECPLQARTAEADPKYSSGCPEVAFVTADGTIKITQKVNFDEGKATLRPDGREILDEVAAILTAHPEIDLIEVAGHTDNTGNPDANQRLSEQRAEAVAIYLTEKGVAARRLMPKGYGQTAPVDTNRTTAGRANNRRIEFVIRRWEGAALDKPTTPSPALDKPVTPAPEPALDKPVTPAPAPAPVTPATAPADGPIWR